METLLEGGVEVGLEEEELEAVEIPLDEEEEAELELEEIDETDCFELVGEKEALLLEVEEIFEVVDEVF